MEAIHLGFCQVTAKATTLFATTASFGMLVMSMQNLGLIGMMRVEWPLVLDGIFSICKFLLLDIDAYGFSCIAGRTMMSTSRMMSDTGLSCENAIPKSDILV